MQLIRNLLTMKRKYTYGLLILLTTSLICVAFSITGSDDFDFARREILLRRIGHEILLKSGDSTSRVLPVKKIGQNEYQVSFEQPFTFQPDFLVNTTQQVLSKDPLSSDFVVKVLNCTDASVAYGFALTKNKKDDIVACKGRIQPIGCYQINVQFKPIPIYEKKRGYMLGILLLFALAGFILWIMGKPKKDERNREGSAVPFSNSQPIIQLGATSFDTASRKLLNKGNAVELTKTETRVLKILALSPNEAIERSRLQKEIWEDEGVIVGRSLDMFISKLRKKLEIDVSIKIVVIRGKGYKLEINT